ncbi:MAG: DUF4261 domain-containing protein [Deltaproteobacteria bacterium]|nr:DUF4261 domain-containing protein [Deltaproteobacteria bacterium]
MNTPAESTSCEIVLCVPGRWTDRSDLVRSIVEKSGGYLYAGQVLMHVETNASFELLVEGPDDRMAEAFRAAGRHWIEEGDLELLRGHTHVLYLIAKAGSFELAQAAMEAADALLRAGGLAVKVETTGVAHRASTWHDLVENRNPLSVFRALVITAIGEPSYSCGMHNLGLRDAIVSDPQAKNVGALLGHFCLYHFTESPVLRSGETFALGPDEPIYRLEEEPCTIHDGASSFRNPLGMWRLVPQRRSGFGAFLRRLTGGTG